MKTISINIFDSASIDKAIKEIEKYEKEIERKTKLMQRLIAERLAELSQSGFDNSILSDLIGESGEKPDVKVTIQENGNITAIVANGEDAFFVEFGAGVYHNGSVGQSPHPDGSRLGFTIGSYGYGRGKQERWIFKGEDDETHWTHGTPASMPMYNAMKEVCKEIEEIAREVFE